MVSDLVRPTVLCSGGRAPAGSGPAVFPDQPRSDGLRTLWYAEQAAELILRARIADSEDWDENKLKQTRQDGRQALVDELEGEQKEVARWIRDDRLGSLEQLFAVLWRVQMPVDRLFPMT